VLVTALREYSGPFLPRTALITPLLFLPLRPILKLHMNELCIDLWRHLRNLFAYLAPESPLVSPRKHVALITALLGVAAIAGAVVLTPSHRGTKPELWPVMRQRVSKRAQVDLFDNFSHGLDDWETGGKPTNAWSYDKNGFVNPGALSVFAPSMPLVDYDLDALLQIEAKGIGMAFRVASSQSYQVAKLIAGSSGGMSTLALERYAVISGHASRPIRTVVAERFQHDTLYRIHLEVRGDAFALYVQGNLIDYWSDPRLSTGGVGLFCSPGEHARVAWVRVSHNTDSLGRMCSWLASVLGTAPDSGTMVLQ
jgi:hypothetical protein